MAQLLCQALRPDEAIKLADDSLGLSDDNAEAHAAVLTAATRSFVLLSMTDKATNTAARAGKLLDKAARAQGMHRECCAYASDGLCASCPC